MEKASYIAHLKILHGMASTSFTLALKVVEQKGPNAESKLILNVQYLDIISQRIEHLMKAHKAVMQMLVDDLFKNSFLHLQYFHFQILKYDLLSSLGEIKDCLAKDSGDVRLKAFFLASPTLEEQAMVIEGIMKNDFKILNAPGPPPLTSRQISECSRLYTMESERLVLKWFLSKEQEKNIESLISFYLEMRNSSKDSTELF
jgi:hypothetical protein